MSSKLHSAHKTTGGPPQTRYPIKGSNPFHHPRGDGRSIGRAGGASPRWNTHVSASHDRRLHQPRCGHSDVPAPESPNIPPMLGPFRILFPTGAGTSTYRRPRRAEPNVFSGESNRPSVQIRRTPLEWVLAQSGRRNPRAQRRDRRRPRATRVHRDRHNPRGLHRRRDDRHPRFGRVHSRDPRRVPRRRIVKNPVDPSRFLAFPTSRM